MFEMITDSFTQITLWAIAAMLKYPAATGLVLAVLASRLFARVSLRIALIFGFFFPKPALRWRQLCVMVAYAWVFAWIQERHKVNLDTVAGTELKLPSRYVVLRRVIDKFRRLNDPREVSHKMTYERIAGLVTSHCEVGDWYEVSPGVLLRNGYYPKAVGYKTYGVGKEKTMKV